MATESKMNPENPSTLSRLPGIPAGVSDPEAVSAPGAVKTGLEFERHFSTPGLDPFEAIEWETRDALIGNEKGEKVFEQKGVEVPKFWSQTATNVVVSKYFRGELGTPQRETSVRQLISRVVDSMTGWGREGGYFASEESAAIFEAELAHILLNQYACFNSPVWFNVGIEEKPQCSACFINSVEDTMQSILGLAKTEGMLFKYGSGTGSNLSSLRSSRESLAGGGTASGPVSFMKGFDAFAGVIKSGGKTRRAAKMVILNAEHPDILDFIRCKEIEERKAWTLIDAGYPGGFNVSGGAYDSIAYQNANHSVRVTDEFMKAVVENREWTTRAVRDGRPMDTYPARDLMQCDRRVDLGLRRPRHAVRHDDQRLAHLPELCAHQRFEPVLRVHVPRRHGMQPCVAQPAQVPRCRSRIRRRELPPRLRGRDHGAGDRRRLRQLPDQGDRKELARLSPAWVSASPTSAHCSWPAEWPTTPTAGAAMPRRSQR